MKPLLTLLLLCSCSNSIISNKSDYILLNNNKYISTHIDTTTKTINNTSSHKIAIINTHPDTIYIFSTVLNNPNMFYSPKNIHTKKNTTHINSFYKNFINDAPHSGIKKFNFIRILPGDSLIVNHDKRNATFTYYYFINHPESGLYNITKHPIKTGRIIH